MKRFTFLSLLLLACLLTFTTQAAAKNCDFTFGDFDCFITSENNAEVSIAYNYYGDFGERDDFKTNFRYILNDDSFEIIRCKENKLIFP